MPTYLYCLFRDRVEPAPALAGVGGGTVRAIDAGGLTAWVESIAAPPPASAGSLRRHDEVTSAGLASGQTPLPVRFGESFDSDDACRTALAKQEVEFFAALERITGRVEMTVAIPLHRIEAPASVQPVDMAQASPGRAYLERLRGERHEGQILQQQGHVLARPVVNAVRPLVIDERATLRPAPPTYLVSHLIARSAVEEYRRLVSAAIGERAAGEPPRAIVRGPSAPYSFTTVST